VQPAVPSGAPAKLATKLPVGEASRIDSVGELEGKRVFAVIDQIRAARAALASVNVFLNCPYLNPNTPVSDPHFVGTFNLFALDDHASHAGVTVQVELTESVVRLRSTNPNNLSTFEVQMVPLPLPDGMDLELKSERIRIFVL
jgi:tyrosinase